MPGVVRTCLRGGQAIEFDPDYPARIAWLRAYLARDEADGGPPGDWPVWVRREVIEAVGARGPAGACGPCRRALERRFGRPAAEPGRTLAGLLFAVHALGTRRPRSRRGGTNSSAWSRSPPGP